MDLRSYGEFLQSGETWVFSVKREWSLWNVSVLCETWVFSANSGACRNSCSNTWQNAHTLTHTHSHTDTHTHTFTRTRTHAHTLTLIHIHSHTHTHSRAHSHSHALTDTFTHIDTHARTHTHSHTCSHTLTLTHAHTLTHTHSHTLTHIPTRIVKYFLSRNTLKPKSQKIVPDLNKAIYYKYVTKHRVMTRYGRVEAQIHALLISALLGGWAIRMALQPLYSWRKNFVVMEQEAR